MIGKENGNGINNDIARLIPSEIQLSIITVVKESLYYYSIHSITYNY